MTLDRIAIALRPRGGYEAIDLGARMLQAWWRPIYIAWFSVYLPFALAVHGALWEYPFAAFAVLFWLKPLFDRFVLHVVSRAVFGDTPTLAATLSAWREILGPGLLASLTWRRWLDYARSFTLPVFQLEGQRGAAGRVRRRQLGQRLRGYAVWLTVACFFFLLVLWVAASFIGYELLSVRGPVDEGGLTPAELFLSGTWWDLGDNLAYVLAESLIEPFFVTAGFALYLSRRVMLEGWDVELGLRRLARRLEQRRETRAAGTRSAAAGLLLALLVAAAFPSGARADPQTEPPAVEVAADDQAAISDLIPDRPGAPRATKARDTIVSVLEDPVFGSWLDARHWRARVDQQSERGSDTALFEKFGKLLAGLTQSLSWIALGGLVLVLIVAIARRIGARADRDGEADAAPARLFGLAIAPDSLPADVAAAALALLELGRVRDALSLIYRGALSCLVHQHGLRVPAGDTEGDVVAKAARMLPRPASDHLAALVRAWIGVAYAGTLPDVEIARQLCRDYARHFAAPAAEPRETNLPAGAPA